MRNLLIALTLVACGTVYAQVPEYLGETYVQAAWLVMEPNASHAAVFFDKGYGTYPIPLVATINWKLTVGGNQYKYALFRIRDGGVLTDDYWATETAAWTAYQTHKNAETLKAASGRFANFNLTTDYVIPRMVMPVVWKDQMKHSSAETPDRALLVLRKQDGTYQWTVRGQNGDDAFTPAATLEEAKAAAEATL